MMAHAYIMIVLMNAVVMLFLMNVIFVEEIILPVLIAMGLPMEILTWIVVGIVI